ncbi:hypothetical protein RB195_011563 [Necator americanus]|uniref:BZIP domain-containing protein n=1 Tax=Necator americanus TaxID=51031 RepID=A0ABR1D342_NECAM
MDDSLGGLNATAPSLDYGNRSEEIAPCSSRRGATEQNSSTAAQRMRRQRANETEEAKNRRLRTVRERVRLKRANDTLEQRLRRLQADRDQQRRTRLLEKSEEKSLRLQKIIKRQRIKRAQETIIERLERLHSETERQRARRMTESEAQRRNRKVPDRNSFQTNTTDIEYAELTLEFTTGRIGNDEVSKSETEATTSSSGWDGSVSNCSASST